MNYAPTVHYPYADVSGIIHLWAESCEKMAVFEHGPDEGQKTLHVHLLIEGCKYSTPEGLKRIFHSNFLTTKKGNDLWAWTHKEFPVIQGIDSSGGMQYLKYMTKGHLDAKFLKNISPAKVEEAKALWVNKSPDYRVPAESKSEFDTILHYLMKKYAEKDIPSVNQFKNDICYHYLSKRKPVPRMGDLTRFSYSAFMIMKSDRATIERKDDTLMSLISDFVISYDSGNIK